ncbi:MAG TPA: hypothetical protein VGM29_11010 [Polyangiaceae bacterium]
MQSLASKRPAATLFLVHSAPSWRPLFVPPGIQKVRTGRTTPAELARLTEGAPPTAVPEPRASAFSRLLAAFGLVPAHGR